MEKLAEDLRMEILLRLPDFKSILRCKCLSKSWYSLISSPKFTDLHFQRSSSQHAQRFLYTNPPERIRSIDINASFNDHSATIELDFPLIKPYTDINIITSCRGFLLLMLVKEQLLFLWNPTTGLHKQISNPPLPWVPTISYGFCYDESVDDYLVVAFNFNDPSWLESFVIFSLRTNSWQKLTINDSYQLPKITIPFPVKSGSFLNGSIHWLISCCDPPQVEAKIIALDITTKDLREIPGPPDDDDNCMNYDLGVVGGFLTVSSYYKHNSWGEVKIWRMREYGVNSSWTKLISLSGQRKIGYILPLCFTRDGEILAVDSGIRLSKWSDGSGNLLEYLEFWGRPRKSWVQYTETIHSLPLTASFIST